MAPHVQRACLAPLGPAPLPTTPTRSRPRHPARPPTRRLVNGTRDLLRQQAGLAHHANYHEFCRLLGRLKANYQLSELVRPGRGQGRWGGCLGGWLGAPSWEPGLRNASTSLGRVPGAPPPCAAPLLHTHTLSHTCTHSHACGTQVGLESYKEWIQLVADFTISSLNSWQWASGSVYYLLGLWCAPRADAGEGTRAADAGVVAPRRAAHAPPRRSCPCLSHSALPRAPTLPPTPPTLPPAQVAPGQQHAVPQGRRAQPAGRLRAQNHARLHHVAPRVGCAAPDGGLQALHGGRLLPGRGALWLASGHCPVPPRRALRPSLPRRLPAHIPTAAVQAVVLQGAAEDPLDNDEQLQVRVGDAAGAGCTPVCLAAWPGTPHAACNG